MKNRIVWDVITLLCSLACVVMGLVRPGANYYVPWMAAVVGFSIFNAMTLIEDVAENKSGNAIILE